jgi:hypothetical protein
MCAAKIRRVKSFSGRYPWDSAKERRPKGYALVNTQKIDFLAACTVKSPWAKDGALPILASAAGRASGPGNRVRLCQLISGTRQIY